MQKGIFNWCISHQLMVAGVILLAPLLIVSSLYLSERNREISALEQQSLHSQWIEPLYQLLQTVSTHRGLLHINLQAEHLFLPLQKSIDTADKKIGRLLQQLDTINSRQALSSDQLDRISHLWSRIKREKLQDKAPQANELFERHSDISENVLHLLNNLGQSHDLFPELRSILIKHIPNLSEDAGLLRGHAAGHMALSSELNHLGDGVEIELSEEDVHDIRHHLTLTQRDFIDLRNALERTFVDGMERDQTIPLMYDLVSDVQELEDLIHWDILNAEEATATAEEFFRDTGQLSHSLSNLATEVKQLYLHRIYLELEEQRDSRNWVFALLTLMVLLAIFLASSIVKNILSGLQRAVGFITPLGNGDYDHAITPLEISYHRSIEMGTMLRAIERTRNKLQYAAEETEIAHRKTREQNNFLNDLTDNMQNGVYALDKLGHVSFINPAAEKLLGYRSEELIGKNIHEIIHSHLPDGTFVPIEECPVYKAINNGHYYHIEHDWFIRKDNSMVPVEFNAAPLINEGKIVGSVAVFNDISQRLEMEEQLKESVSAAEAANQSKSDFLANMSHEIRTPMNAIIGLGYLALQTDLDEKQRSYISKIHSAAKSLLTIINDILDFSKIEAGKLEVEQFPFQLREVADNTCQLLMDKSEEKGIELQLDYEPSIPQQLLGDPSRIGQILTNLITNAIKFTDSGTIKVRVAQQKEIEQEEIGQEEIGQEGVKSNQASIMFTVQDQGIGITQEQQQMLFQPFTQADGSISRKYGGTGLGLSISRQLVEIMGGTISVESQPGEGSTFRFTLPLTVKPAADTEGGDSIDNYSTTAATSHTGFEGRRILLVEDNNVNQLVATELLKLVGIEVTLAEDGQAAIDYLNRAIDDKSIDNRLPDLVLMDIQMPILDGYKATQLIRQNPRLAQLPVIAMTANATAQDRDSAIEAGMDAHIAKPINPELLYQTIREFLSISNTPATQIGLVDYPWQQIDYSQGVEQVEGRESLYRKVLSRFVENQHSSVEQLKQRIDGGATEEAHKSIHTIAGVAHTIGALQLQQQAERLAQALEQNYAEDELTSHLNAFSDSMGATLKEIHAALSLECG